MTDGLDPAAAQARLADADRVREAVRRQSKWYVRYLIAYGIATIGAVIAAGFISGPVSAVAFAVVWTTFVAITSIWGNRFGATRRGFARTHMTWLAAWIVLYMAALFGGLAWFPHQLAWYLPAGIVASFPAFITAYLEARR